MPLASCKTKEDEEVKYFLDTEFSENGSEKPITLISIGIVAEDGRKFYAIHSEFDPDECNDWVKANVLPKLEFDEYERRATLDEIEDHIRIFCDAEKYGRPEFWGYYADYDWVVFCQIFGAMVDLPKDWPMYCRDLKQWSDELNAPKFEDPKGEHNALVDAKWNFELYKYLEDLSNKRSAIHFHGGIGRIASERRRQIEVEGWTPEHDASHVMEELAWAAISYAAPYPVYEKAIDNNQRIVFCDSWPMNWERGWDKRQKHSRIRKLEIAGALIAAEIDRLERLNAKSK